MTISINHALEIATESIVKSMGLEPNTSAEDGNSLYLAEGSTALVVLDNQLLLGEVEHDIAHMDSYEVNNVQVAGKVIFREEFHYADKSFRKPEFPFGTDIKIYND
jgi:hypothetical protein